MYAWLQGNVFTKIATIYPANITLNASCIQYFEDIRWCLIGLDRQDSRLAIKLLTMEEVESGKIANEIINKVSVGKSYVRISNKAIIKEIAKLLGRKCDGLKFVAEYNDNEKFIEINLNEPI